MEIVYKSPSGLFEAKLEGKGHDDLFEQVADFMEVFEVPNVINKVEVPLSDIKFVVRENEGNKFYEQRYTGPNKDLWGFRRSFHMKKVPKGAMYPDSYLKTDEEKANYEDGGNGWRRWKGSKTAKSAPTADAAPVAGKTKDEVPF